MRLRTFSAPNMATAMQQIRDVLGDDAIIVSSHQSERGRGVQVTAAVDEAETVPDVLEFRIDDTTDEPDAADQSETPSLDEDTLFQSLIYHDVPEALATRLTDAASQCDGTDTVEALAFALDRYFEFRQLTNNTRPTMLIGPAGAGKTVTTAKLAAASALRGDPAAIITTDTVRAGAKAQLSGYTDILQQPLFTADDPESLHAVILNNGESHILIDTPSTNPFNSNEMADLRRFITVANADPVLVLPAGINTQDAADIGAAYARLGCKTLIATQLDGARRLGAILAAAQGGNLAFSVVSISPSIANGLTPLNPMSLARVLLRDPEESHAYPKTGANQA